jgi:hypothetical protein
VGSLGVFAKGALLFHPEPLLEAFIVKGMTAEGITGKTHCFVNERHLLVATAFSFRARGH